MIEISSYKNKDVGILGAGLSGLAAAKILLRSEANLYIFDDKKDKDGRYVHLLTRET